MKSKVILVLIAIFNISIAVPTIAAEFDENSANIDNIYLSLKVGTTWRFIGSGEQSSFLRYRSIVGTDIVEGVKCLISSEQKIGPERNHTQVLWLAQDVLGAVYLLKYWDVGEDQNDFVELGKSNALFFFPKNPQVGDKLFGGTDTVVEIGVTVPKLSTGLGPFTNCIKFTDEDKDIKYLAPIYSDIKKDYADLSGGWELKEFTRNETSKNRVIVVPLFE